MNLTVNHGGFFYRKNAPVFNDINFSVDSGEILAGSKVHIGYYDQEQQLLNEDKTLFDELGDAFPAMTNTEIRNVLAAFLFTGEERVTF